MPRISIIIPAYNPGSYLREAIQSVLTQEVSDLEVVVVDDGSKEDLSYVDGIDARVRRLAKVNGGQSSARNYGIEHSDSELIGFLDQDDLFLPTKLRRQIDLLESRPAVLACHTQFRFIDSDGKVNGHGYGQKQSYEKMLQGSGICGSSTVLLRRDVLKQVGVFRLDDEPVEDLDLWLRIARAGEFDFITDPLVSYRIHGNNQSRQYRRAMVAIRQLQLRHAVESPEFRGVAVKGIRNYERDLAGKAFEQLRDAVRVKSIREIVRHGSFVLNHQPQLLVKALVNRIG